MYLKSAFTRVDAGVLNVEKMLTASTLIRYSVQPTDMKAKKSASEALIGVENLSEIAETALFSAHLTKSIPTSLVFIGPSGAGKSKLIMQYENVNGSHLTSDITSSGLQELLAADPAGKIKFLIVPDFNVVLSHRASTLQLTIANLLSVTSEGTVRIDDGRLKKETKHAPCGILTAMTRDLYSMFARKWAVLGFNRRFLPIYYDYSLQTRQRINTAIMGGYVTLMQLARAAVPMPKKPQDVGISPGMGQRIQGLSDELANNIGYIPTPTRHRSNKGTHGGARFAGKQLEFSPHLALRSMARAHALRDGRRDVKEPDLDFLFRLIGFTRYDRPGQL